MTDRRRIRIKGGGAVRARGGLGGAILAGAWVVAVLAIVGIIFWVRSQPDGAISGRKVVLTLPSSGPEHTEELIRPRETAPPPGHSEGVANEPRPAPTQTPATVPQPPAPAQPAGGEPLPVRQLENGRIALAPAPDPALVAAGPDGPLPIIDPTGRRAWRAYARPFSAPADVPRVAVVVEGLGMNAAVTNMAIEQLPGPVTLAFMPYADNLQAAIDRARAAGHEVLIELPMEPYDFPQNDPGPAALRTGVSPTENLVHLEGFLARATGYVGAMNYLGAKFMAVPAALRPVLAALNARGLLFFDSHSATTEAVAEVVREVGIPFASGSLTLDEVHSRPGIQAQLAKLVEMARQSHGAVAVGGPYPATVEEVASWSATLQQANVVLAPLSALSQPLPAPAEVHDGG